VYDEHLDAAEEQHLRSLTAAEAEGDERAVEAALRPRTLDEDEKTVFELVQTASGVGPKLAQAMIAVLSPDDLRRAVAGDDVKTLTRVPGIGQKGAQRIILELKDRLGAPVGGRGPAPSVGAPAPWRDQVQQGLVGLGWTVRDAEKAVETVAPEAGELPDVAALLRAALRTLSKA